MQNMSNVEAFNILLADANISEIEKRSIECALLSSADSLASMDEAVFADWRIHNRRSF